MTNSINNINIGSGYYATVSGAVITIIGTVENVNAIYNLIYSIASGSGVTISVSMDFPNNNTTTLLNTGLDELTTYYYQVNGNLSGADSNVSTISGTTTQIIGPVPSLIPSSIGDTNMVLTWTAPISTLASTYYLQRGTDGINYGTTLVSSGARAPFSDTGLTPYTTYYYRVWGVAPYKNVINYTYLTQSTTAALSAPSVPVASSVTNTTMTLTWGAVTFATGYVLQRATNSSFTSGLTTIYTGSGLTFGDTGLSASTTYYYRVYATGTNYTTITYSSTCTQETT